MYLDHLKERFKQSPTTMFTPQGVTLEQIRELEAKIGLRFPAAYTEFLLWLGGNATLLLEYGRCNFDLLPDLTKNVMSALWSYGTDDARISLSKTDFVFWTDTNSYRFYFIEAIDNDDPPVYFSDAQRQNFGFRQSHLHFSDFIRAAIEREIAARVARTAYFAADAQTIRPTYYLAGAKALWQNAGLPAPTGLSPSEILDIEREAGFIFPPAFREYLLWLGNTAEILWQIGRESNSQVQFLRPFVADSLQIAGIKENLPNVAFPFLYQEENKPLASRYLKDFWFLYFQVSEGNDPPVHRFNSKTKQFELNIAPAFSSFLENAIRQRNI